MLVALAADLHANRTALAALAGDLQAADRIVFLGDAVGYYTEVNEALDLLRGFDPVALLGNHDAFVLEGCPDSAPQSVRWGVDYARGVIAKDHLEWLAGLPLVWDGVLGGASFLGVHGSPWNPLGDYLYEDSPALDDLASFQQDVIAFGQTHRPLLRTDARPILINPGSIGQSRHRPAVACAALFDTGSGEWTMIERPYDVSAVVDRARAAGAGDWITKHLEADSVR